MHNLPDELRERVLRLKAELLLDLLRTDAAVWLACDLLVAGVDTPALLELAGESPTGLLLADATPLVRQVLTELEVEPIDESQAAWVVARDIARQMIAGELRPEDGAHSLWGLWSSCDGAAAISVLLEPLEAWDETPPADRDDEAIRAWMRELAHGVVDAAHQRLAATGLIKP
ncbi:hypothetical protein DFR70_11987 [Nocardia tenerifensis]|uniref:Uncharacterized protein n=1 Tax=Nocardia tenerifensis TaxID=228006 RepID=A0A318JTC8_9NOCA|nr:hypothetical protein [Nocardia tenerifensis]PXX56535.1 hypothetical protein DFR70_11987 [Nocardia tenerifensis]